MHAWCLAVCLHVCMFTVYVCWMYLSDPIYLLHYASMYFSFGAFFLHRGYNGRIPYINAMVPQSLFSFNPDLTQAFSMQAQHRTEILRTSCRIHGLHQGALNPTWVWGDLGLGYAGWWYFIPAHSFWTISAQSGSIWSRTDIAKQPGPCSFEVSWLNMHEQYPGSLTSFERTSWCFACAECL